MLMCLCQLSDFSVKQSTTAYYCCLKQCSFNLLLFLLLLFEENLVCVHASASLAIKNTEQFTIAI